MILRIFSIPTFSVKKREVGQIDKKSQNRDIEKTDILKIGPNLMENGTTLGNELLTWYYHSSW